MIIDHVSENTLYPVSRLKQHLDGMKHSTQKITGHCKRLKIAMYVVYGEMLCTIGDERCLFMSLLTRVWSFVCLKYWACSRCLVSFNLVPFYWRGGRGPGVMGLVLSRSREGGRREIVGTRLSSIAVLCLLKVPSIF